MKKIILILLMGILMNPTFHLYGIKITLAGDLQAARDRAHLARLLMFKTKLVNVNNLDIIQNNLRLNDGTYVHVMSQHGFDSATIYVPPRPLPKKPEYIEKQVVEIIPYLFAPEESFGKSGLLICHGGYDFSGGYELFSPYGDVAYSERVMQYQPLEYEFPNGDTQLLEFQVKEFYDYMNPVAVDENGERFLPVFWDEVPWMAGAGWDPVHCPSYQQWLDTFDCGKTVTMRMESNVAYDNYPQAYHRDDGQRGWSGFTTTYTLYIGDIVVTTGNDKQWYDPNEYHELDPFHPYPGDWHYTGEYPNFYKYAVDQDNPSKYGVLYTIRNVVGFSDAIYTDLNPQTVSSSQTVWFKGLGHNEPIPGITAMGDVQIKIFLVGDKYVCLFSLHGYLDGEHKILGSAVEGGDFFVKDLLGGILYKDEYRDVFTSDEVSATFGILKRIEPTKRIKKEQ